jgi:hypothetical protein
VAADAAAQIRTLAWTDPATAADAAWATSDTLHVAAAMLGRRILRQAADAYDRAARSPYGRIPPPTPAGNRLRQAARLLSAFAYLTGDRSLTPIVLITKLAAPPLNASMPPSAQHPPRRHAQRRAPAPPPGSPRCPSRRQLPAASRPYPDSPAPIRAARGHHHHAHAVQAGSAPSRHRKRTRKEDHGPVVSRAVRRGR